MWKEGCAEDAIALSGEGMGWEVLLRVDLVGVRGVGTRLGRRVGGGWVGPLDA